MEQPANDLKTTALFQVDTMAQKVVSLSDQLADSLGLHLFSVTTDQPLYWPDESVHLKVIAPFQDGREVVVHLERKDASPRLFDPMTIGAGGLLVERLLDGTAQPIEAGEYRVEVRGVEGILLGSATFSVVEGALGAVSLAHDFEALTDPRRLEKVSAGWYLGNASGAGLRWGNGLNLKNEIRVFNEPYTGPVTVNSRCYLPGCDGVAAGPSVNLIVKGGQLSAVLEVGGHSGPFEIEVVTNQGTVRHLFGRSGHIERQMVPVSGGLTRNFTATLAPYQGTREVYGRGVFIGETGISDDPWKLASVVVPAAGKAELLMARAIHHARLFLHTPTPGGSFEVQELFLDPELVPGRSIPLSVTPPYSLLTVGGFEANGTFVEGWALIFPEANLITSLVVADQGGPGQTIEVEITTQDRRTGTGVPIGGILEVFDTRVASTSPRDPLVSTLGDSFRNLSNSVTTWRDWTGMVEGTVHYSMEEATDGALMAMSVSSSLMDRGMSSPVHQAGTEVIEATAIQETIREGEQKVVFCAVVHSGPDGRLTVPVTLPPQVGRVTVRLVAVEGFDTVEATAGTDVSLDNYLEVDCPGLIDPSSQVMVRVMAVNGGEHPLTVRMDGPGGYQEVLGTVEPGSHLFEWELSGERVGVLSFLLVDGAGQILDRRVKSVSHPGVVPITFSDIVVSGGESMTIEPGNRVTLYTQPAALFAGMASEVVTVMYSWFSHAEALSASCAVRAILLHAFEKGILSDDGLRALVASDLKKTVNDLRQVFYQTDSGLVSPYPGLEENLTWSAWVWKYLDHTVQTLERSDALRLEFATTIGSLRDMRDGIDEALRLRGVIPGEGFFDPATGQEVLPVEIGGKVIYRAITDDAVIRWYTENIWPSLDIPRIVNQQELNTRWVTAYDQYRFLRAFERTGVLYPLLLHAEGLYQRDDDRFFPLFQSLSRTLALVRDPGLIRGPAMLGGVYGAPQTLLKYLDLLLALSLDQRITQHPVIEIQEGAGEPSRVTLGTPPLVLEAGPDIKIIQAPPLVTMRIDRETEVNLAEMGGGAISLQAEFSRSRFSIGEEGTLSIELDQAHDPSEYYALIVLPSVLSGRQTGDLLFDYRGTLITGQRASGGSRILRLSIPFRGSRRMIIPIEAMFRGASTGTILVRHVANPSLTAMLDLPRVVVE